LPPSETKDVVRIGGPNGAGKTTMAAWLLPNRLRISEFDSSDGRGSLVAAREGGGSVSVHDQSTWKRIEEAAR
jgi:hypothetical protein